MGHSEVQKGGEGGSSVRGGVGIEVKNLTVLFLVE